MEDDTVEPDVVALEAEGTVERAEVVEVVVGLIDDVVTRRASVSVVDRDELTAALVPPSAHDTTSNIATAQAIGMG